MKFLLFPLLFLLPFITKAQSVQIKSSSYVVCPNTTATFTATTSGISNPNFRWYHNRFTGSDTSRYVGQSFVPQDRIFCQLTNSKGDTVYASSDTIIMRYDSLLMMLHGNAICVGDTIKAPPFKKCYTWQGGLFNANAIFKADAGSTYVVGMKPGYDTIRIRYFQANSNLPIGYDVAIFRVLSSPANQGLSGICLNSSRVMTDALPGGVWSTSNPAIATINETTGLLKGVGAGTAMVYCKVPWGCTGRSRLVVDDCGSGVELFPVPARYELVVRMYGDVHYDFCTITDNAGRLVHKQAIIGPFTNINTSTWLNGHYVITFSGDSGNKSLKFLKE